MRTFVVNGLNMQPVDNISASIASWGFNCVRLTFSTELVVTNPMVSIMPRSFSLNWLRR